MPEQSVEGLALSSKPLGENDRLLTLLTDQEGLLRLAVPGARRPKSSLAGAVPLAHLRLQVGGGSGLQRVRQLKTLHNIQHSTFSKLSKATSAKNEVPIRHAK